MGKNSSKLAIQDFMIQFDTVAKDQKHNLTYLRQKRSNTQFLLKQVFANDRESISYIQQQFERKKNLIHEHITILKQYYIAGSDQFCSSIYRANALYEFPFRTLEEERKDRMKSSVAFDHDQLLSILASLVLAFSYLQKNHIQHETVRTNNIYLDTNGTIKISDPYAKQLETNYQLYRHHPTRSPLSDGVYLSPSQLRALKQQQKYPIHNPYKSDVFCLGVVLLQLSTLRVQDDLYSFGKAILNEQVLSDKVDTFGKKYGAQLKKILSMMVCISETQRLDWNQLEIFVKKQQKRHQKRDSQAVVETKEVQSPQNSTMIQRKNSYGVSSKKKQIHSALVQQQNNTEQFPQRVGAIELKNNTNLNAKLMKQIVISEEQRIVKSPDQFKNVVQHPAIIPTGHNFSLKIPFNSSNFPQASQRLRVQSKLHTLLMEISNKDSPLDPIDTQFKIDLKTKLDQNFIQVQRESSSGSIFSDESDHRISHKNKQKTIQEESVQPESGKVSIVLPKEQAKEQPKLKLIAEKIFISETDYNNGSENKKISLSPSQASKLEMVKQVYKQGATYQGEKMNGMRHGKGKFYYKDGGVYQGDWQLNRMQGYGKLFYTNGKLAYEGEWKEDHFQGFGKFYNQNPEKFEGLFNFKNFDELKNKWKMYEGQFINDIKEGKGVLILENGERYEGQFKADKIHGDGIFHTKDNRNIIGKWERNKLVSISHH